MRYRVANLQHLFILYDYIHMTGVKDKYKYRINSLIEELPRGITISEIEEILKREHNISRDTFLRDRTMLSNDKSSIPFDRMEVYASLFDVHVDQLKNYKKKKIKPLNKRKL